MYASSLSDSVSLMGFVRVPSIRADLMLDAGFKRASAGCERGKVAALGANCDTLQGGSDLRFQAHWDLGETLRQESPWGTGRDAIYPEDPGIPRLLSVDISCLRMLALMTRCCGERLRSAMAFASRNPF